MSENGKELIIGCSFDWEQAFRDCDLDAIDRQNAWLTIQYRIIVGYILATMPPEKRLKALKELGDGYKDLLLAYEQKTSDQKNSETPGCFLSMWEEIIQDV